MAFRHPMRGLGLRPGEVSDLPAIEEAIRSACVSWEVLELVEGRFGDHSRLAGLCCRYPSQCLVAYRRDRVIGCIAWRQDEFVGVLLAHVVMQEFQDLGIGTALVRGFVEHAREDGLRLLELRVPALLERAGRIYLREGFRETGRWIYLNRGDDTLRAAADDSARITHLEEARYRRGQTWCQYGRKFSGKG